MTRALSLLLPPSDPRLRFPVDEKIIAGATHCAFDGHGRAKEVWSAFLGE